MELRHIRYFLAAGEELNFVRAARKLHIAQPALSRQIQDLERFLGIKLFERLGRGVRLTEAGQNYLKDARQILSEVEQANDRARRIDVGQIGTLKIGLSEASITNPVFGQSIRNFRMQHPDVELSFSLEVSPEQINSISRGSLDVGFLNAIPEAYPQLNFELLSSDSLMLALPLGHPLARRSTIRLRDLRECDFIAMSRNRYGWSHDQMIVACVAKGFSPRVVQAVSDPRVQLSLISAGLGVGFVHHTQRFMQYPNVVVKRVKDLELEFPIYLVWKRDNRSPIVLNYLSFARNEARVLRPASKPRRSAGSSVDSKIPRRPDS